jgi:putative MATE family efflux protein
VTADQPPKTEELRVWALAWPMMTLFALHALVGLVDLIFVSGLGTEAVAAVGVASQIHWFSLTLLAAVTTGTVAVVAREWGRGHRDEAVRATRCSLILAAALGGLLMLAIPAAEGVVSLLGVDRPVTRLGGECLAILLLFTVPLVVGMTLSMALRAAGDVRTPLLVGIVGNAFNVAADWALIYGHLGAPELGAVGSAWASGLTFALDALILAGLWLRNLLVLPAGRWRGSVTLRCSWRLLRIGIPTALEQATFSGGLLAFMGIVSGFGTEPVSAYLIGVRILAFCFVPGMGYSMAASTIVGQQLGAERPNDAARAGWRATLGCVSVMSTVGLVIMLFARPLSDLFGSAGDETTALAVVFIYILGAAQPFMAAEFALGGGLRGAGDTKFPLFAILLGLLVFRLGGAVLIARPLFGTVTAVWCCLLADWGVKAALLAWRFASGRWKEIDV